jgi:hypothetical protein
MGSLGSRGAPASWLWAGSLPSGSSAWSLQTPCLWSPLRPGPPLRLCPGLQPRLRLRLRLPLRLQLRGPCCSARSGAANPARRRASAPPPRSPSPWPRPLHLPLGQPAVSTAGARNLVPPGDSASFSQRCPLSISPTVTQSPGPESSHHLVLCPLPSSFILGPPARVSSFLIRLPHSFLFPLSTRTLGSPFWPVNPRVQTAPQLFQPQLQGWPLVLRKASADSVSLLQESGAVGVRTPPGRRLSWESNEIHLLQVRWGADIYQHWVNDRGISHRIAAGETRKELAMVQPNKLFIEEK